MNLERNVFLFSELARNVFLSKLLYNESDFYIGGYR